MPRNSQSDPKQRQGPSRNVAVKRTSAPQTSAFSQRLSPSFRNMERRSQGPVPETPPVSSSEELSMAEMHRRNRLRIRDPNQIQTTPGGSRQTRRRLGGRGRRTGNRGSDPEDSNPIPSKARRKKGNKPRYRSVLYYIFFLYSISIGFRLYSLIDFRFNAQIGRVCSL